MDYSVIICTRNRARELDRCLSSMLRLEVPLGTDWELIVVDNNSVDDTAEVVMSFIGRLPVRLVIEKESGLSNARNGGVASARGRYIIWTDDDVMVHSRWLAAYIEAFREWPEAAVFGGRVIPYLEGPTPPWFSRAEKDLHYLLAARDFGDTPVKLSFANGELPFGANFAVRTVEQRQHLFDPALGVAPGRRRGGEETAVLQSILAEGHVGWWVPLAKVEHIISGERQTVQYVRSFYEGMGEASAFRTLRMRPSQALKAPIATWIKIPLAFVRFGLARTLRVRSWVRYMSSFSFHYGALKYYLTPPERRV